MEPDVIVENITKTFDLKKPSGVSSLLEKSTHSKLNGRLVALDNISFSVNRGEMFGIIGTNGSGKTTLLRIISGIYHPDKGNVQVNGRLAPLLQIGTGFHNELIASENIVLSGMLSGMTKNDIKGKIDDVIEFAELEEFANMKLKYYSSGMRARLAFATALQINPEILLVDEILSVGDMAFREKSYKAFLSFKESGKTILYSTHNLNILPKLCDRVLLIHNGKMIMIGKSDEVIEKYKEMSKVQK